MLRKRYLLTSTFTGIMSNARAQFMLARVIKTHGDFTKGPYLFLHLNLGVEARALSRIGIAPTLSSSPLAGVDEP